MKLSPIDIQQQQFRKSMFGLERAEVRAFLDLVAQEMAALARENQHLKDEVRRVRQDLHDHVDKEQSLKEAMLTAQRAIDSVREQAQKEAQLTVADAELRAQKLIHHAHSRVTEILEELRDLKRQRVRFVEEVRGLVNTHLRLLDVHESEPEIQEATVTVLDRIRAPAPPGVSTG